MSNKLTTLINIYPYLLIENNLTKDLFNKYKRWVYELEYEDLCFNSGQVQYQIETDSMEEIFEIAKFLSKNNIKWEFRNNSRICGWKFNSKLECIYKELYKVTLDDVKTYRNYGITVNVPLKYNSYIKFINIIKELCSINDMSIEVLNDFPNTYMPRYEWVRNKIKIINF